MIKAKVICDSIWNGKRITSLEITMPRFLLAQFNTHRVFSRSAASSRAIPTAKLVDMTRTNRVEPVFWGKNQAGMQAHEELEPENKEKALIAWHKAALNAANSAEELAELGCHKQIVNRLLEPFLWASVIVTATEWDNFFKLRLHEDSQPEMQKVAQEIQQAMTNSEPVETHCHLPYITKEEIEDYCLSFSDPSNVDYFEYFVLISAARCARVSYLNHDQSNPDIKKDLATAKKLLDAGHCFTPNTEILTNKGWVLFENLTDESVAAFDIHTGKFKGFEKPTNIIKKKYNGNIYKWNSADIDIEVTDQHKLLGCLIGKYADRKKSYESMQVIIPNEISGKSGKTNGEREMILFSAGKPLIYDNVNLYNKGKLIGFFIGDGYAASKTSIHFRLKLERKISYLINLLNDLKLEYRVKIDKSGVTNIVVFNAFNGLEYYNSERRKCFPHLDYNVDELLGIFDGLKNSDGHIKRNTWVYDTMSSQLCEQILALCPLIGLTGRLSNALKYAEKGLKRISFTTNNHIRVNDTRTEKSKVEIKSYSGDVFCVTIPSKGIMVRRNGKTLLTHNCSPFEHQACGNDHYDFFVVEAGFDDVSREFTVEPVIGIIEPSEVSDANFIGWIQARSNLDEPS